MARISTVRAKVPGTQTPTTDKPSGEGSTQGTGTGSPAITLSRKLSAPPEQRKPVVTGGGATGGTGGVSLSLKADEAGRGAGGAGTGGAGAGGAAGAGRNEAPDWDHSKDGIMLGFDANGNKILKNNVMLATDKGSLGQQSVEYAVAGEGLSMLSNRFSRADVRIQQEFFYKLEQKYKDVERPVGMDIYTNPDKYTVEQKMARYVDLLKASGQFDSYLDKAKGDLYESRPQRNSKEIQNDLDQAMKTIASDPKVAEAITNFSLSTYKEILEGKTFDPGADHGKEYQDAVNNFRNDLQDTFKQYISEGVYLQKKNINERTLSQGFTTYIRAFASVLPQEFLDKEIPKAQAIYDKFYNDRIAPKLPDSKAAMDGLLLRVKMGLLSREQLGNMGTITPLIDGKLAGDILKDNLTTTGIVEGYKKLTADSASVNELKKLGVDQDALNSTLLTPAAYLAKRIVGENKADAQSEVSKFLIQQSRSLIELADSGKLTSDAQLDAGISSIVTKLKADGGPAANFADQVALGLKGLVRGSILSSKVAAYNGAAPESGPDVSAGSGPVAKGSSGFDKLGLAGLQRLTAMSVGFEGKAMALNQTKRPAGDEILADKVFGAANRSWDSAMIRKYGKADLVPLTDAMTRFATSEVGTRAQGVYYSVNDVDDMKAMSVIFGPISQAYADATVGKDDPIKNANASANFTRMLYDMVGLLKPGGQINTIAAAANKIINGQGSNRFETSVSAQNGARWLTTAILGARTVYASVMNQPMDPITSGFLVASAFQGAGAIMTGLGRANFTPGFDAQMDRKFLAMVGDQKAIGQLQMSERISSAQKGALKGAAVMDGIANVAWLGADINWLVRDWKAMDNPERAFVGLIVATDFGSTVVGTLETVSALGGRLIQGTRFASMMGGTFGTGLRLAGGAMGMIGGLATIAYQIYQEFKGEKEHKKYMNRLHDAIWNVTGDEVKNHLGRWDSSVPREQKSHEFYNYDHEITPVDWNKIQSDNQARYDAAYGSGPEA